MASPGDRLIYLICGACEARIVQALDLTLYDIAYVKLINDKYKNFTPKEYKRDMITIQMSLYR